MNTLEEKQKFVKEYIKNINDKSIITDKVLYCYALSIPETKFRNGKYYIELDNKTIEVKYSEYE